MNLSSERPAAPFDVPPAVPIGAKVAGALFIAFAIASVVNAASAETDIGLGGERLLPRATLRLLASIVITWGLARGSRWAWWLGLMAGTIWFVMSIASVAVLDRGDIHWLRPSSYQFFPALALVSLGLALALLLSRAVRAAFRGPRG